ncbi:TetR family transcriptional regulator [Gordonia pseudamarae]|jgi:AcrR family transcriptional regulator|uniref:TetR family transcriptional regulator n=1 Tax=Gordonia pseudamarae TaxID=2831662 RepID=A0ABX6IDQ5_9ACTN|nr:MULTISPECIES: TetR family transcriptional regulator [Gordonia]MBD0022346.1 TetR/AcrR family transcriptional regulator C-terminal domain-containing protein [Gordonia sp. (in: high G+C Gram-positive bacteria)]QHN25048.1 TetR family transcriptional regulator [Gordonia pseudamarae]QHN33982.1 TetR family transcriptional regulator [Gordonia pseudamarae]
MAGQESAPKRKRRERGSIDPEEIINGAFELAEEVSIDNLSMPMLGKHLGVGVTSIYWYFRKKDDLLNAMTDRAITRYRLPAAMKASGDDWRSQLHHHAHSMRQAFLANPILCDLLLIRSTMSTKAGAMGAKEIERIVALLMEAGLSLEDAYDSYSAVQLHIRGSIVLERLYQRSKAEDSGTVAYYENLVITAEDTPRLAEAEAHGWVAGAPNDHNFEYVLNCILDNTARLIAEKSAVGARTA